jgi:nodulation protein E
VQGQAATIVAALRDARLAPDAIDYVNAHGTATALNDVTETQALKAAFGTHAARLAISSTKSMHGHMIGATGAMELAISVLALERQQVPPTAHLTDPDPACDLDYVPVVGRDQPVGAAMTTSFAFGGTSGALVVTRPDRSQAGRSPRR